MTTVSPYIVFVAACERRKRVTNRSLVGSLCKGFPLKNAWKAEPTASSARLRPGALSLARHHGA